MKRFWVVGGVYKDTNFDCMAEGYKEERVGPFRDYAAAKAAWQKRAWETVDHANARFRIEEEGGDPCYWVVGGPYCDTRFDEPAAGGGEEWYGPFDDYNAAKIEWSRRAWSSSKNDIVSALTSTMAKVAILRASGSARLLKAAP